MTGRGKERDLRATDNVTVFDLLSVMEYENSLDCILISFVISMCIQYFNKNL